MGRENAHNKSHLSHALEHIINYITLLFTQKLLMMNVRHVRTLVHICLTCHSYINNLSLQNNKRDEKLCAKNVNWFTHRQICCGKKAEESVPDLHHEKIENANCNFFTREKISVVSRCLADLWNFPPHLLAFLFFCLLSEGFKNLKIISRIFWRLLRVIILTF